MPFSSMRKHWWGDDPTHHILRRSDLTVSPKLQVRAIPAATTGPALHAHPDTVRGYSVIIRENRLEQDADTPFLERDMGPLGAMQLPDGRKLLFDGFHRLPAYAALQLDDIPVELYVGDEDDAVIMACLVNTGRGLQFSDPDKLRMTKHYIAALLRKNPGQLPSNNRIALRLQVHRDTVVRAIAALATDYDIPAERIAERVGRDGVAYEYIMRERRTYPPPSAAPPAAPPAPPAAVTITGPDDLLDVESPLSSRLVPIPEQRSRMGGSYGERQGGGSYAGNGHGGRAGWSEAPRPGGWDVGYEEREEPPPYGEYAGGPPALPDAVSVAPEAVEAALRVRDVLVSWTYVNADGEGEERTTTAEEAPPEVRAALLQAWGIRLDVLQP